MNICSHIYGPIYSPIYRQRALKRQAHIIAQIVTKAPTHLLGPETVGKPPELKILNRPTKGPTKDSTKGSTKGFTKGYISQG